MKHICDGTENPLNSKYYAIGTHHYRPGVDIEADADGNVWVGSGDDKIMVKKRGMIVNPGVISEMLDLWASD